ncbi:hypothetical protein [Thalassospira tepidiphila]|uniref:Uncharacterized protein n=1 Tax=Thalassospira tepidiphila TaxID=393657 RepID=A0ABX0X2H7_9PROT|nr:hypothetical protein [Thalassospira tepidiphila]NJB75743.1 hypothetical protein [Thalassospira tepidiphila]
MTVPLVLSLYLEKNRGKKQFVFENFSAQCVHTPDLQGNFQTGLADQTGGKNVPAQHGTGFATKTEE